MIDNPNLSAARSYRETPEVVSATCRLIYAVGKRIATEDPEDLELLELLETSLRDAWTTAIGGLRRSGYSDSDIGAALATSKQNVQQRWPRRQLAAEEARNHA